MGGGRLRFKSEEVKKRRREVLGLLEGGEFDILSGLLGCCFDDDGIGIRVFLFGC